MKKILMLDCNGNLTSENPDVIGRHIRYSSFLSEGNFLIVISAAKKRSLLESGAFSHITIKTKSILKLRYFLEVAKWISKNRKDTYLFICPDPWQSWIIGKFLIILFRLKIPIQVQAHGDFADDRWSRLSVINRIKTFLAKFSFISCTQIRCVSLIQSEKLIRKYKISSDKIYISPVPLNVQPGIEILEKIRPRSIGFVGRIQNERGLFSFSKLISRLNEADKEFKIIVIGEGPESIAFRTNLELILDSERLSFDGSISSLELARRWDDIGVLVSTAESESFGRSIHEAVVYGVPVWGVPSAGILELKKKVSTNFVSILNLNEKASILAEQFDQLLTSKCSIQVRKEILYQSEDCYRLVAESWNQLVQL